MTGRFDHDVETFRQLEFGRRSVAMPPTLDGLRALNARQLRARAAMMLEQLDYEFLTIDSAADLIAMKVAQKFVTGLPRLRITSRRSRARE
jgi:hypothetical protein